MLTSLGIRGLDDQEAARSKKFLLFINLLRSQNNKLITFFIFHRYSTRDSTQSRTSTVKLSIKVEKGRYNMVSANHGSVVGGDTSGKRDGSGCNVVWIHSDRDQHP